MFRALAFVAFVTACHPQSPPELRVLGTRHEVVYVQVTNPAPHAMRLEKLDYKFEAAHQTVAEGVGGCGMVESDKDHTRNW